MIFLNNTLKTLSHIVFNISLGLMYDQCHTLHAKPQVFLAFVLVIVNAIDDSQDINYFKIWLRFPCHSTCEKLRFDPHNIISIFVVEFS